jgi:VCBS repeat-containing protein
MTIYSPNLVVNGDFSQGDIGFVSDYSYVMFNNSETQYMIQPVSKLSGLNIWGTNNLSAVSTDPLGGDGNVLYANGATEPNKLVWGETVSVTPNTEYVFTFYAVDANSGGDTNHEPYDAVLLGSVNGVASVQLNTNATWQQATLIWNSGSNTTANLSLVDLNTQAGANDFAVDLISFAAFVATPDRGGIQQGSTLTVNAANGVLANDTDPIAGDTLHATAVSYSGHAGAIDSPIAGAFGALTLHSDGSYTYTAFSTAVLPADGVGQDVFTYTASTGSGGTADSTLTVNVTAAGLNYIGPAPGSTIITGPSGHSPVLDGGAGNLTVVASNGATVLIGGPGDT